MKPKAKIKKGASTTIGTRSLMPKPREKKIPTIKATERREKSKPKIPKTQPAPSRVKPESVPGEGGKEIKVVQSNNSRPYVSPEAGNVDKFDIACYAGGWGRGYLPHGAYSCITSEAHWIASYAVMLSYYGHNVDLITRNGVSDYHKHPPGLYLGGVRQKKYDICVCLACTLATNIVEAEKYILINYSPKHKLRYREKSLHKFINVNFADRSYLKDYPTWHYPMDIPGLDAPNKDSSDFIYICKHNHIKPRQRDIFMGVCRQLGGVEYIGENIGSSLPYDLFLDRLKKFKLALSFGYGCSSLVESINCGCLPTLWTWEKSGYKGGYDYGVDMIRFDIDDTGEQYAEKLRQLVNPEYYVSTWEALYRYTKLHLFENSYREFKELIGI